MPDLEIVKLAMDELRENIDNFNNIVNNIINQLKK